MASGPQHYREAQEIAQNVSDEIYDGDEPDRWMERLALAQIHATLALAAAAAVHPNGEFLGAWLTVFKEEGTGV